VTTAAPTTSVTENSTRMLEESHGYKHKKKYYKKFLSASTLKDAFEQKMRRISEDDGAGQMCPEAPTGCYEDFFAGGNEWSQIPGCEEFIGANTFCDQSPEDAADVSTDVEESGSGLVFVGAAFYVWMGCA